MRRSRIASTRPICSIDVTAFASVMLVLVMTLLRNGISLSNPHHGVSVDIPKVILPHFMAGATREDAIVITIMRDGKIYLRNNQITKEELTREIGESVKHGAEERIYICADEHVYYLVVRDVLGEVRQAGVENVTFFVNGR
jgi:biopolymer transport protein ExbD